MKPHRFVPKPGNRWRYCDICDLTQSADVHRAATNPPEPDTEEDQCA